MVRNKDGDGIKSNLIISEVQKRPCLFDMNHPHYGDRAEKARCWEDVCETVVPGWSLLGLDHKFAAGREVQKRWRSIRDSYTKAYRQGKCELPEHCAAGSRRYQHHAQMAFLLTALKNRKPRLSQDRLDGTLSEISNSPQHSIPEDLTPKIKIETTEKPLDLKKPEPKSRVKKDKQQQTIDTPQPTIDTPKPTIENIEAAKIPPEVVEKAQPMAIVESIMPTENKNASLEIKIDANTILPDDHFDDDKLFMNSLLPSFKKMDDDTRLLCRIEVLKIIRYALQGHKNLDSLRMAEQNSFRNGFNAAMMRKEEIIEISMNNNKNESTLSMTTRSADGSRPIRKRLSQSPAPSPPAKRRGPGRPRKIRPPPSDSDEDTPKRRAAKMKSLSSVEPRPSELDEELSRATSVAQLRTPLFMKMYNLERSKTAPALPNEQIAVAIKTEPADIHENQT
ncbi:unnamed protein product [Plutella xylostella]|uniref:(diamondback moth) hypothetical protein n=1 Tax=Plutella xylostella TaxID=51655 RepID=A0A8S4EKR1_PLUXY|nr:unnamed protein product [Plutella xylostella]